MPYSVWLIKGAQVFSNQYPDKNPSSNGTIPDGTFARILYQYDRTLYLSSHVDEIRQEREGVTKVVEDVSLGGMMISRGDTVYIHRITIEASVGNRAPERTERVGMRRLL